MARPKRRRGDKVAAPSTTGTTRRRGVAAPGLYADLSMANEDLKWHDVPGEPEGVSEVVLVAHEDGSYTHLMRVEEGVRIPGPVVHDFYEEAYYLQGEMLNSKTGEKISAGSYVFHEPGEEHGPFRCVTACLILEFRYFKPHERSHDVTKRPR